MATKPPGRVYDVRYSNLSAFFFARSLTYINETFAILTHQKTACQISDWVEVRFFRDFSLDHPETVAWGRYIARPQKHQYTAGQVLLGKPAFDFASKVNYNRLTYNFPYQYTQEMEDSIITAKITTTYTKTIESLRADKAGFAILSSLLLSRLYTLEHT